MSSICVRLLERLAMSDGAVIISKQASTSAVPRTRRFAQANKERAANRLTAIEMSCPNKSESMLKMATSMRMLIVLRRTRILPQKNRSKTVSNRITP